MRNFVFTFLKIYPGEGKLVAELSAYSFLLGVQKVFTGTTAQVLFLSNFSINELPYVYIGIAIFVPLFGLLYLRFHRRFAFPRLIHWTLLTILLTILTLRALLDLPESKWVTYALAIWFEIEWVLTNIQFWGLANRLLDLRQGKRLFGLIGSGEVIAIILCGISVHFFVMQLGVDNLLFLSAFGAFSSFVLVHRITQTFSHLLVDVGDKISLKNLPPWRQYAKEKYVLSLFAIAATSLTAYYFIDRIFFEATVKALPEASQLASFLGLFSSVTAIVTLFSRLWLTERLINFFGIKISIRVLPICVLCFSLLLLAAQFLTPILAFILGLTGLLKLLDRSLRDSIDRSSLLILYQPLPTNQRLWTQTTLESIIEPVAGGIAGISLLVMINLFHLETTALLIYLSAIAALWLLFTQKIGRQYLNSLKKILVSKGIKAGSLKNDDSLNKDRIIKGLKSKNPGEVLLCLRLLETLDPAAFEVHLSQALSHPHSEIQAYAITQLEDAKLSSGVVILEKYLAQTNLAQGLRRSALAAIIGLDKTRSANDYELFLDHPDEEVREGAMLGLLRYHGLENRAGRLFIEKFYSSQAEDQQLALSWLQLSHARDLWPFINLWLDHAPLTLQKRIIQTAGEFNHPSLWRPMLKYLQSPHLRNITVMSLSKASEEIIPLLVEHFTENTQNHEIQIKIVHLFGHLSSEEATIILALWMRYPREDTRHQTLIALRNKKFIAPLSWRKRIETFLRGEVADAAWTITAMLDLQNHDQLNLLEHALAQELARNQERIFALLSFLYKQEVVLKAWHNYDKSTSANRAFALEIIEHVIGREWKNQLFPVLEDLSPQQRFAQLNAQYPQQRLSLTDRLQEIILWNKEWISPWTQVCAVYAVGLLKLLPLQSALKNSLLNGEEILRETALWAYSELQLEEGQEWLKPYLLDSSLKVSTLAQRIMKNTSSL